MLTASSTESVQTTVRDRRQKASERPNSADAVIALTVCCVHSSLAPSWAAIFFDASLQQHLYVSKRHITWEVFGAYILPQFLSRCSILFIFFFSSYGGSHTAASPPSWALAWGRAIKVVEQVAQPPPSDFQLRMSISMERVSMQLRCLPKAGTPVAGDAPK